MPNKPSALAKSIQRHKRRHPDRCPHFAAPLFRMEVTEQALNRCRRSACPPVSINFLTA